MTWHKQYNQGQQYNRRKNSSGYSTTINQQGVFPQTSWPSQYSNKHHTHKHHTYNNPTYKSHNNTGKINRYNQALTANKPWPVNKAIPQNQQPYLSNWSENNPSRHEFSRSKNKIAYNINSKFHGVNSYIHYYQKSLHFVTNLCRNLQQQHTFDQCEICLFGTQIIFYKLGIPLNSLRIRIFTVSEQNNKKKQINEIKQMLYEFKNKTDGIGSLNIFPRNSIIGETAIVIDFLDDKTKLDITLYPNFENNPTTTFAQINQAMNWNVVVSISPLGSTKGIIIERINYDSSIKEFLQDKYKKSLQLTSPLRPVDSEAFYSNMASVIKIIFFELLPNILAMKLKDNPDYPQDDFKKAWHDLFLYTNLNQDNKVKLDHDTIHQSRFCCNISIDNSLFNLFKEVVEKKFLIKAVFHFIMENLPYINKFEKTFQQLFLTAIINYGVTNLSPKPHAISECLQQNNISDQQLSVILVIMLLCTKNSVPDEQFRCKIVPIIPNMPKNEKLIYCYIYHCIFKKNYNRLNTFSFVNKIPDRIKTHSDCLQSFAAENQPNSDSHPIDSSRREFFRDINQKAYNISSGFHTINSYMHHYKHPLHFITHLSWYLQQQYTLDECTIFLFGPQIIFYKLGVPSNGIDIRIFTFSQYNDKTKQINEIRNIILSKLNNKTDGIGSLKIFQRNSHIEGTAIVIGFLDGTQLNITLYANFGHKPMPTFAQINQSMNWNVVVSISPLGSTKGIIIEYINYDSSVKEFLQDKFKQSLQLTSSLRPVDSEAFYSNMVCIIKIIFFELLPNILIIKLKDNPNYPQDDFKKAWYDLFLNINSNQDNKVKLDHDTIHQSRFYCNISIDNSLFNLFKEVVEKKFLIKAVFHFIMENFSYINEFEKTFQQLFLTAIINYGITNVSTKQHAISECLQQNKISEQQLSGALVIMLLCTKNGVSLDQFRNKILPLIPKMTKEEKSTYPNIYHYIFNKDHHALNAFMNTIPNHIRVDDYCLQLLTTKNQSSPDSHHINNQTITKCRQSHLDSEHKENQWDQQETKQAQATDYQQPYLSNRQQSDSSRCKFVRNKNKKAYSISSEFHTINSYIQYHNNPLHAVTRSFWELNKQSTFSQFTICLFGTQIILYKIGIFSKNIDIRIFTFSQHNNKTKQINEIRNMISSKLNNKTDGICSLNIFQRNLALGGTAIVIGFLDGSKLNITLYANFGRNPMTKFANIDQSINWNVTVHISPMCPKKGIMIEYINYDSSVEKFLKDKFKYSLQLTSSLKPRYSEEFYSNMASMIEVIFFKLLPNILAMKLKDNPNYPQDDFKKAWYNLFLNINPNQDNKVKLDHTTTHQSLFHCDISIDNSIFNLFKEVTDNKFLITALFYFIMENFSYINEFEDIFQQLFFPAITSYGITNVSTKQHTISKYLQQNKISEQQLSGALVIMLLCTKNSVSIDQFKNKIVPLIPNMTIQEKSTYPNIYDYIFKKDHHALNAFMNRIPNHIRVHDYCLQLLTAKNQPNPNYHHINNQTTTKRRQSHLDSEHKENQWDQQATKQAQTTNYQQIGLPTHNNMSNVNCDIKRLARVNQAFQVNKKIYKLTWSQDNSSRTMIVANYYTKFNSVNFYIHKNKDPINFIVNLFWTLKQQGTFNQYAAYLFGTQIMCYTLGIPSKDIDMKIFTFSKQNNETEQVNEIKKMILSKRNNKTDGIDSLNIFQRNSTGGIAIIIDFLDGTKLDITLYANCFTLRHQVIFDLQHPNNPEIIAFDKISQPMNWNIAVGISKEMVIKYINYDTNLEEFLKNNYQQSLRLTSSLKVKNTKEFHIDMAFMLKVIFLKLFPDILKTKLRCDPNCRQDDFITAWYRLFGLDIKTNQPNQVKNEDNKIKLDCSTKHKTSCGCEIEIDRSVFILFESVVQHNFHIQAVFYLIMKNFSYIKEFEKTLQQLFLHAIIGYGVTNISTKHYTIAACLQQHNISDRQLSGMLVIMLLCRKNGVCADQFRDKILPFIPNISNKLKLDYWTIYRHNYNQLNYQQIKLPTYMQIDSYILHLFTKSQLSSNFNHINNKTTIKSKSSFFASNQHQQSHPDTEFKENKATNQEAKESQSTSGIANGC